MRQELAKFELGQLWIADQPANRKVADAQLDAMQEAMDTIAIPLHTVVAPDGSHLARFTYTALMTPEDYLRFLARGKRKYEVWKAEKPR